MGECFDPWLMGSLLLYSLLILFHSCCHLAGLILIENTTECTQERIGIASWGEDCRPSGWRSGDRLTGTRHLYGRCTNTKHLQQHDSLRFSVREHWQVIVDCRPETAPLHVIQSLRCVCSAWARRQGLWLAQGQTSKVAECQTCHMTMVFAYDEGIIQVGRLEIGHRIEI